MYGVVLHVMISKTMSTVRSVMKVFVVILAFVDLLYVDCFPACNVGQFFDTDIGMCEYCHIVCDEAEITGTIEKCQKNCPAYLTTVKPTPAVPAVTTTHVNQTTPTPLSSLSSGLHVGEVIAVIISVVVVAVVVVAVVLYKLKSRPNPVPEEVKKFPVQVENDANGEGVTIPGLGQNDRLITSSTSTVGDCCV